MTAFSLCSTITLVALILYVIGEIFLSAWQFEDPAVDRTARYACNFSAAVMFLGTATCIILAIYRLP